MNTFTITSSHQFKEAGLDISDIIAIDDTHYLLACFKGLLKTTKDQLIEHYYNGKMVKSLCHVTDSLYLVGLLCHVWDSLNGVYAGLVVWNEQ
jgi:hypothetical protein